MKERSNLIPIIILLLLSAFSCKQAQKASQDWPQFLGPDRNSTSDQKGILRLWPETGPKVLWNTNAGIGYGGPVIKDGKVYLLLTCPPSSFKKILIL